MEDNGEDRISRLPDALIHHILSFIDTKYAVQSSVLSKRYNEKFVKLVDMVLLFRDDSHIQKFFVEWDNSAHKKAVIGHVNRWMLVAVRRNVQEITVRIGQNNHIMYKIPHQLFNCKSLRKLSMIKCGGGKSADTSCCIHLGQTDHGVTSVTKLCAPKLKDFVCTGLMTQEYSFGNFYSLVSAAILMKLKKKSKDEILDTYSKLPVEEKEVYAKSMMKFLVAVHKVASMRLSFGFLELEMWFTRDSLRSIAYLLRNSPIIYSVVLTSMESNSEDIGTDWEAGLSLPGMLSRLKIVEIKAVVGCDSELKLLSFLLKNARSSSFFFSARETKRWRAYMQWGDHKFVRVFVADRSYQDNGQSQPHEVEDSAKYIHIMQSSSNQITGILEQITKLQTPTALQFTEQAGDVHPSGLKADRQLSYTVGQNMRALHSIKLFGVSNMECENKYDGACLQIYVEP
ncbi:hypothetical protein C5167_029740 [Papaver somniferum]|nr:hypothetical protein C5167_029740 [Papaver somniferum]